MSSFDYNAPAELFLSKPTKGSRTKYRRFATAAEAIRYAVEDLRTPKAFGAWLEVGDERFNSSRGDISKGCRVVPADADPRINAAFQIRHSAWSRSRTTASKRTVP
jgi:hypothetical protein